MNDCMTNIFCVVLNCFDFKVILVRNSVEKSSPTPAVVDTTKSTFFLRYRLLLYSISFPLFVNTVQPEVFIVIAKTSVLKKKKTYA